MTTASVPKTYIFTQVLALFALVAVLMLDLLPALLGGLLVYQTVEFGAHMLSRAGVRRSTGRIILLVSVTLLLVAIFTLMIIALMVQITNGPESIIVLLQRMADVIATARNHLPLWAQDYLPASAPQWQEMASTWLRDNARELGVIGRKMGGFLIHLILGMIIGGMIASRPDRHERGPLGAALTERIFFLARAFRRVVFSQIRISALNTLLTGIFLGIILPLSGNPLPLTKTMIVVTFLVGLLPIVGNLISNTVIFLIALSVSPILSLVALGYLIVIHKLEYFINARIIGARIQARAWEILLAMLVMESAFGIVGLVAAPIYYAYLKDELSTRKLI